MRVAIADDAAIVREGLARLLEDNGVEVCGVARDAEEALAVVARERPDIAILDIRMPPTHTDEGLRAAEAIGRLHPEVGVLVLSQYVDAGYALRLVDGGRARCGYLLKERVTNLAELVDALERVDAGESVVDRELVEALLARRTAAAPLDDLTARELEVLALVAEGLTDRGIAERLWLTQRTVETHVRHILQKLDLPAGSSHNRRVHAVLTFLRAGTPLGG